MAKASMPAQVGWRIEAKDSNGVSLIGATKTDTFNTQAIAPRGATRVGLMISVSAKGGTSPTLDPTFQMSPDGGTTWVSLPATANSQTQAAMAQITDTGTAYEWYEVNVDPVFGRIRAVCTVGGTSETFTFNKFYWILSHVVR